MRILKVIFAAAGIGAVLWSAVAMSEVVAPPADVDFGDYARRNGVSPKSVEDAAMTGWLAGLIQGCGGEIWTPLFHGFMSAQKRQGYTDRQVDSLRIYFDIHRGRSASKVVPGDCTEDLARLLLDSAATRLRAWETAR